MNVHEDTLAQALGFCMRSRTCPLTAFVWDCFPHSPGPREQSTQFTGRDLGLLGNSPDLGNN